MYTLTKAHTDCDVIGGCIHSERGLFLTKYSTIKYLEYLSNDAELSSAIIKSKQYQHTWYSTLIAVFIYRKAQVKCVKPFSF